MRLARPRLPATREALRDPLGLEHGLPHAHFFDPELVDLKALGVVLSGDEDVPEHEHAHAALRLFVARRWDVVHRVVVPTATDVR